MSTAVLIVQDFPSLRPLVWLSGILLLKINCKFYNYFKNKFIFPGAPVNHAKAYGRIAFSCPFEEQPTIDKKIQEAGEKILTPLISLDTPGKATVRVIILADPDDHEICFVDDESFRKLSQVDPASDAELDKYIKSDKSRPRNEWFF